MGKASREGVLWMMVVVLGAALAVVWFQQRGSEPAPAPEVSTVRPDAGEPVEAAAPSVDAGFPDAAAAPSVDAAPVQEP